MSSSILLPNGRNDLLCCGVFLDGSTGQPAPPIRPETPVRCWDSLNNSSVCPKLILRVIFHGPEVFFTNPIGESPKLLERQGDTKVFYMAIFEPKSSPV